MAVVKLKLLAPIRAQPCKCCAVARGCHAPINCGEICDRAVKVLTENFLLQHCIDEALASFIAKSLLDP